MDENDDEDFYGQRGCATSTRARCARSPTITRRIYRLAARSWTFAAAGSPATRPTFPEDVADRGDGHGAGIRAQPALTDFEPKNLNVDPTLPYDDNTFDAATCVVSVDYLIKPLEVFKEINRVLKPGGKFILSQSNRCFQTKAVMMWLQQSDLQHCQVIGSYFHYAGGFAPARAFDVSPKGPRTNDPLFIVESTKL